MFLRDIYPGNSSSVDPGGPASSFNGQLYFSAWEPVTGSELWRTDGTLSGTLPFADIVPGPGSSHPFPVALGAELLVFSDDGGIFNVLKTDGTPGNLTFITSLGTSSGGCDPRDWRLVSGPNAFFRFASAAGGCELWKSDGTAAGTALVKDIEVGAAGSNPGSAFDDGGRLVFVASTGAAGAEPWVSDGTSGGTAMIADVNPGPAASGTSSFTAMGGQIYFSASTPHGLWKTDLSPAGTTLVAPIYLDPGTNRICNANGTLLFAANSGPQAKHELWKSDGTPAGTVFVKDLCPQSSSDPRDFFTIGGVALFVASGYTMDELWRSDGTVGGTYAVKDLTPESTSAAKAAGVVNGRLLFAARDALHGGELWLSDGTDTGTFLIGDIDPTTDPIAPSFVGAVGGQAIVASNNNPPTGREPWRTSLACLDVTPVQLPHATLGQPYGCTLTATGGAPPYVFALTSGSLPAGLTLSASGSDLGDANGRRWIRHPGHRHGRGSRRDLRGPAQYALAVRHGVDILAGCGQGQTNPNEIVTTDPAGFPTGVDFLAYAAGQWGALVAAGDVDGGATDEILTGPGPGPSSVHRSEAFAATGPRSRRSTSTPTRRSSTASTWEPRTWTVTLFAEILTAPGPGPTFGPIRGWNFDGITVAPLTKVSFFAYLTLKYGANVGAGDVEGDGYDEILTGPGRARPSDPTFAASTTTTTSSNRSRRSTSWRHSATTAATLPEETSTPTPARRSSSATVPAAPVAPGSTPSATTTMASPSRRYRDSCTTTGTRPTDAAWLRDRSAPAATYSCGALDPPRSGRRRPSTSTVTAARRCPRPNLTSRPSQAAPTAPPSPWDASATNSRYLVSE
ncbi:MAG: hypothetical protein U0166_22945 [Acidobacteriota bacterium]